MKLIQINSDIKTNIKDKFLEMLNNYNSDGDITFKLTATSLIDEKKYKAPIINMTALAYIKMQTMVKNFNKELAWHGTVSKQDNVYTIDDVMLYPQTVTATTAECDETEYGKWLMQLDDESINRLRFQGHSHVSMGVSPSGTDLQNWKDFMHMLKKDQYYIFCIYNKKDESTWCIYDMSQNLIFENKDITFNVVDDNGNSIATWYNTESKKYIGERITTTHYYAGSTAVSNAFNFGKQIEINSHKLSYDDSDVMSRYDRYAAEDVKEIDYTVDPGEEHINKTHVGIIAYVPESDIYISLNGKMLTGFYYSQLYDNYIIDALSYKKLYSNKVMRGGKKK